MALCHLHKYIMDAIDVNELMKEFVYARDNRAAVCSSLICVPSGQVQGLKKRKIFDNHYHHLVTYSAHVYNGNMCAL